MTEFYWLNTTNLREAGGPFDEAAQAEDDAQRAYAGINMAWNHVKDHIAILKRVEQKKGR